MRVILLLSFFVIQILTYGQKSETDIFRLNELPEKGVLLDKGWKFYPEQQFRGRVIDFKSIPGIDINPAVTIDKLPAIENAGVGWFHLNLDVDSALRNRIIGVTASIFGAAEIYLNKNLVKSFGKTSSDYKSEKTQAAFIQVFNLQLNGERYQELSIRYSFHQNNIFWNAGAFPSCLSIILKNEDDNLKYYRKLASSYALNFGTVLIIQVIAATLTLFFFVYFPSRKEYLYFGLYFLFQFIGLFIHGYFFGAIFERYPTVNGYSIILYSVYLFFVIASFCMLNGVYSILKIKRTKFYRVMFAYAAISIVVMPTIPAYGFMLMLFFPLTFFEIIPAYYKAVRKKIRGAWILLISMLLTCIFTILTAKSISNNNMFQTTNAFLLSLATPVIGLFIFLALDFINLAKSLKTRVAEVEELSRQNLLQQQEKQEILSKQKEQLKVEVSERTQELRLSLENLKSTQTKLIQSEKMASLGELTAGIAHEIQNPLNFINNFSDINQEMADELKEELRIGNIDEAIKITESIKENEAKINQHGKRADAIVKGMMQHSRSSTGKKEPSDINDLCDEYLRLSYHGFQAKNKSFNAELKTDLDSTIGKINIIPQEIGRVMLNIFNNAFYAVKEKEEEKQKEKEKEESQEKQKTETENRRDVMHDVPTMHDVPIIPDVSEYKPQVSVSTKKKDKQVVITIKDNGNGIPQKIIDKIFQPFFTTKPTGLGTGLGLSLSYDIIKAHGGDIKVSSAESQGSEFIVTINANT